MRPRRAVAALARGAWFWIGLAVGLLVEQRRGLGSGYWRAQAQLAWHERELLQPRPFATLNGRELPWAVSQKMAIAQIAEAARTRKRPQ